MKASHQVTSVIRSKKEHPATSLKSDMTKAKRAESPGTTTSVEDKKPVVDETYESNVDSGFLSGSCVYESDTWDNDDQPDLNTEEDGSTFVLSGCDNRNVKSNVSRKLSSDLPELENSGIRQAFLPDEEGDT